MWREWHLHVKACLFIQNSENSAGIPKMLLKFAHGVLFVKHGNTCKKTKRGKKFSWQLLRTRNIHEKWVTSTITVQLLQHWDSSSYCDVPLIHLQRKLREGRAAKYCSYTEQADVVVTTDMPYFGRPRFQVWAENRLLWLWLLLNLIVTLEKKLS